MWWSYIWFKGRKHIIIKKSCLTFLIQKTMFHDILNVFRAVTSFYQLAFICLFVLVFFVLLENLSPKWRPHHYRCSSLIAIEQWGFFSVPHLLWHGTSVYNGHLGGPVTLTPIAKRLVVELSLPVFTTKANVYISLVTYNFLAMKQVMTTLKLRMLTLNSIFVLLKIRQW